VDYRLEVVRIPVSDVDRAKDFYQGLGWRLDFDVRAEDGTRSVQLTPPGSACSIAIGKGIVEGEPGSVKGLQVVVDSADAAHAELSGRGVEVSDVQEFPWGRFVFFEDPDGNKWSVQEITARA
jgi:catechol 2,3-dioxygenase-like lactoylglutathione lyase family enzyme